MKFNSVKKLLGGDNAHIKPRRGTQEQAVLYCMKGTQSKEEWKEDKHDGVSFGVDAKFYEQGTRKRAAESNGNLKQDRFRALKVMIQAGADRDAVFDADPVIAVVNDRWVEREIIRVRPPNKDAVQVYLFYGKPGTNKTRYAMDLSEASQYVVPCNTVNNSLWFDGYEGQLAVIIDDFDGKIALTQLLRLIDRYTLQVPIKGGHRWFRPEVIIITTNIHPSIWYDYSKRTSSEMALRRRFTHILNFDEPWQPDEIDYEIGDDVEIKEFWPIQGDCPHAAQHHHEEYLQKKVTEMEAMSDAAIATTHAVKNVKIVNQDFDAGTNSIVNEYSSDDEDERNVWTAYERVRLEEIKANLNKSYEKIDALTAFVNDQMATVDPAMDPIQDLIEKMM